MAGKKIARLLHIEDELHCVRCRIEAIFMAVVDVDNIDQVNALQSVAMDALRHLNKADDKVKGLKARMVAQPDTQSIEQVAS